MCAQSSVGVSCMMCSATRGCDRPRGHMCCRYYSIMTFCVIILTIRDEIVALLSSGEDLLWRSKCVQPYAIPQIMADVLETRPTTQHGHPRAYSACVLVACIQEVAQYRLSAMLHSSYPQESALAISRDPRRQPRAARRSSLRRRRWRRWRGGASVELGEEARNRLFDT